MYSRVKELPAIPRGSIKKGNDHQKRIMDQFTAIVVTAAGAKQVRSSEIGLYEGLCVSSGIGTPSKEWFYSEEYICSCRSRS